MKRAFSLVEVLAAVALIGILVFLALPNIVQVKSDSEVKLAEARGQALNLAIASYVQAMGTSSASDEWNDAASEPNPNEKRYELIAPYLAYAAPTLAQYMPEGFSATMPDGLVPLEKVDVTPSP